MEIQDEENGKVLNPAFWLIFAAAFWLLKSAFDAGRVVDDVRVRRRRQEDDAGEAKAPKETGITALGRAA